MPLPKQCNSCGGFCGRMCIYTTKADAEIAKKDKRINILLDSNQRLGQERSVISDELKTLRQEASIEISKLKKVADAALYFVREEQIEQSYSAPARVLLDALAEYDAENY